MTTLTPVSCVPSMAYTLAVREWGRLDKYVGIHWNCGTGEEAEKVNWFRYDRVHHPKPPALFRRFRRGIFVDESNQYFWTERLSVLKALYFYMGDISQAIVVVSLEQTTTADIMDFCRKARFDSAKRLHDGAVLVHKLGK